MDLASVLAGKGEPLEIYQMITPCLADIRLFTDQIEPIYRASALLDEEQLDRFRFALVRLQIHSDIYRNEDLEQAQKVKYTAQVIEKLVYGSLMMEPENNFGSDS
jgi:hypothetical protein